MKSEFPVLSLAGFTPLGNILFLLKSKSRVVVMLVISTPQHCFESQIRDTVKSTLYVVDLHTQVLIHCLLLLLLLLLFLQIIIAAYSPLICFESLPN